MKRPSHKTFITFEWNKDTGEEREFVIEYNFIPGCCGSYYEPPYPPEVEVLSIKFYYPKESGITPDDIVDTISEKDMEKVIERYLEHQSNLERQED